MYICLVCFGRQIDRWMHRGPRTAFKGWFSHFPMLVPRTQFSCHTWQQVPVEPSLWPRKKLFHCRQISKSRNQFLNLCMGLISWEFDKGLLLENKLDSNSLRESQTNCTQQICTYLCSFLEVLFIECLLFRDYKGYCTALHSVHLPCSFHVFCFLSS